MQKRILIIDDDRSNGEALNMIMEQEGFISRYVESPSACFHEIDHFNPHLLILDIQLGEADGRLICNEIKENAKTKHLPVILISAMLPNQIDQVQSHHDGMICKPFDINEVVELTRRLLQL